MLLTLRGLIVRDGERNAAICWLPLVIPAFGVLVVLAGFAMFSTPQSG